MGWGGVGWGGRGGSVELEGGHHAGRGRLGRPGGHHGPLRLREVGGVGGVGREGGGGGREGGRGGGHEISLIR